MLLLKNLTSPFINGIVCALVTSRNKLVRSHAGHAKGYSRTPSDKGRNVPPSVWREV